MWKMIFRRFLLMIPQLLILSILVFLLAEMMPGDALTGMIDPNISPAQVQAMREKLGLDRPVFEKYTDWITKILFHGDFGRSFKYKLPVLELIGGRIWNTLWMSLYTTFLTYTIGITLGVVAGRNENTFKDRLIGIYSFLSMALPSFVLGLLMIWLFGYTLDWFPTRGTVASGLEPGTIEYLLSKLHHIVLPGTMLALIGPAGTIQFLRASIIDAKTEDYVRTARAKGVPEKVVYRKHILRNSILPIASTFGYTITGLFSGAIITETVFTYQGMGYLFFEAVQGRDFTVMTTLILFSGFLTLLGGLLSDIIMIFVDPRIRLQ